MSFHNAIITIIFFLFACFMSLYFIPDDSVGQELPTNETDEVNVVTVDGISIINGDNKAKARDEALRDAYRRAIEKGVGITIRSETEMQMLEVLKDVIMSNSEGYVKKWEIKKEGIRDDGLYSVTINAEVVKGAIKKDNKDALKIIIDLMGNPRFLVLIDETISGEKHPYSIL